MEEEKSQNNSTQRKFFSEWLEKLQQESWQLELLISGLALFGIYEARDWLASIAHYIDVNNYGELNFVLNLVETVLQVGWLIFFINLLVHVVLRGLWIGAIGLRYISAEIEYDDLNYSELFTEHLKKKVGSYDDFIERLERICSVLFAFTFLLFLFFLSMIIFFAIFGGTMNMAFRNGDENPFLLTFAILFLLLGVIVFIDFITLGGFKKIENKWISKMYLYIYIFYSFVTLSFLYRPILYNFIDHRYTRKLFFFSIPYFLFIILFNQLLTNDNYPHYPDEVIALETGYMINDNYYDDKRADYLNSLQEKDKKQALKILPEISLKSFFIREEYSSVFLRFFPSDQDLLMKKDSIDPYRKRGLRFAMFRSKSFEDNKLKAKKSIRDSVVIKLKKRKNEILKGRLYTDDLNEFDSLNKKSIVFLDSLIRIEEKRWSKEKDSLETQKILDIKDSMIGHVDFLIDTVSFKDSLDCHYYTHPNLNEKGLLCMFPTRSLNVGKHNIHFTRKYLGRRRSNQLTEINKIIPFYKIPKTAD